MTLSELSSAWKLPGRPPVTDGAGLSDASMALVDAMDRRDPETGSSVNLLLAKIMIVDDEPVNIKVVRKHLQVAGFQNFVTTSDGSAAMAMLRAEQPDVLLLDVMMPHVNGLDILQEIRADARFKHTPVLILTASGDSQTKLTALERGATDFLAKPVDPHELTPRLRNVLIVKAHQDHLAGYSVKLERQVQLRTAELEMSRLRVIRCLARAGEYRDDTTGRHVLRVGRCTAIVAAQLGFSSREATNIELAAQLHDIGKIGIPDSILLKPGRLTPAEYDVMRKHCAYGKAIISPTTEVEVELARQYTGLGLARAEIADSPLLAMAARIAYTHHERWDGAGYPEKLSAEKIPLEGRITAIVDVFDALRSTRPYKARLSIEESLKILREGRGNHFDPAVHDAMLLSLDEIMTIYRDYAD